MNIIGSDFLPTATDADLDRLARKGLHGKVSEDK